MPVLTFEHEDDGVATRLDAFLAAELEGTSRGEVQSWIIDGRARVNDTVNTRSATRLRDGDVIQIDRPPPESGLPKPADIDFKVVFSDDHIAIIDKPPGLTVHPGAGHANDTLVNGLLHRWPAIADVGDPLRPGIVHRLDRDTSGLMAIALSEPAHAALSQAIHEREVTRRYIALVHGVVEPDHGIIDAPISRDPRHPTRQRTGASGRPARTHYTVTAQYADTALLAITLETGRTHQIRVHMAAIDFPVVGDPVYGRPGYRLQRQFLHASGLELLHPATEEHITFGSDLPHDLTTTLSLAREA